jgi:hypothetical protein
MVIVLLGCVGLTAGVAFGTLFSSPEIRTSIMLPDRGSCHQDWYFIWTSDPTAAPRGPHQPVIRRLVPLIKCPVMLPAKISVSGPSGGLPMGDYVLFGFLGGLSAGLGFLVPPKSSQTATR